METEWYIGTMRDADSLADLVVPIDQGEHEALRDAETVIRKALGGMLFRLVFVNHRAVRDLENQMIQRLRRPDRHGFAWAPDLGRNSPFRPNTRVHP